mgnify:FL=1
MRVNMAAIVGQRQQIGIRETGSTTTVPNNDRAKLMYYLSCEYDIISRHSHRTVTTTMKDSKSINLRGASFA